MAGIIHSFPRIVLVGCGNMGVALLKGWQREGLTPQGVRIIEPQPAKVPQGFTTLADPSRIEKGFKPEVVLFAVKPQALAEVLPGYREFAGEGALMVSIAAGKKTGFYESLLGPCRLARVMPSTPALVGEGASVAVGNAAVTEADRAVVTRLLESVGTCHWVADEAIMDAVTALSGSGPAFVFYVAECLAAAGEKLGLSKELSVALAVQTIRGSGILASESEQSLEALRHAVTSPGGTTEAGLKLLMDGRLQKVLEETLAQACKRGRELSE
ncbi:MAG: pyrroline-5-carboxylate reductase [Alphaproteobacteria bacterium]|nr:pyrroline-5-carboxylate reductase [Alphaproteobacteria bacterium]